MKNLLFSFFCTTILVLSITNILKAQDIHFSQFNNSPLTLNPANTGAFNGSVRAIINYKDQWGKVTTPFKTYGFSCDGGLFRNKWQNGYLGIGISIFNDAAGDAKMQQTQANLSVSCVRRLNKYNNLTAGIQGGFAQKSANLTNMTWGSQYNGMAYDPSLPANEIAPEAFSYQDYSAGILWSYGKGEMYSTANDHFSANIGLSMFHINKPHQTFIGQSDLMYSKIILHGSSVIGIKNTNISICPAIYSAFQGKSKEVLFGTLLKYNLKNASHYTGFVKGSALYFGGFYRYADAIVVEAQLEIHDWLLGVSYDVNTSSLTTASDGFGGLEISLKYIFPFGPGSISSNKNARFF